MNAELLHRISQTEDDFFRVNSEMLNTQANMGSTEPPQGI